jgi:hypothetical protein
MTVKSCAGLISDTYQEYITLVPLKQCQQQLVRTHGYRDNLSTMKLKMKWIAGVEFEPTTFS